MRILHVAETIKGGVSTILNQILQHQSNNYNNINIDVIIPDSQIGYIYSDECVSVKAFKSDKRGFLSLLNLGINFLRQIKSNDFDYIHIHSTFAGVIIRGLIFFKKKKSIIIYCPHAFSFLMKVSILKKKIYIFIEKLLLKKTDIVICVSKFEYETALQLGFEKSKLKLIYNGVESKINYNNFEDSNDNDDVIENKKINILFVGRFDYQKGVDILIDAINIIADIKELPFKYQFNFVGDIVNDLRVDLHQNIKKSLNYEVSFLGWIKQNKISDVYSKNDVVIMPSRWEGFGLVAVESFLHGKPVVASDNTSLTELIIDKKTGFLFKTECVSELVNIIINLEKNKLYEMREFCLQEFNERFTADRMLSEIDKIYLN